MIKIQSSFNIIKRRSQSEDGMKKALIDTRVDLVERKEVEAGKDLVDKEDNIDDEESDNLAREKTAQILEKEAYIKELDLEKAKMVEEAKEEIASLKKVAKNKGFELGLKEGKKSGYEAGLEEASKEAESIIQDALGELKRAEDYVNTYYKENQDRIIDLSIAIAESIVHNTIDRSDEGLMLLIKEALNGYDLVSNIAIRVNSKSKEKVREKLDILEREHSDIRFFLIKDDSLGDYDCMVEGHDGLIDLSVEKQLESVLESIKNVGE